MVYHGLGFGGFRGYFLRLGCLEVLGIWKFMVYHGHGPGFGGSGVTSCGLDVPPCEGSGFAPRGGGGGGGV